MSSGLAYVPRAWLLKETLLPCPVLLLLFLPFFPNNLLLFLQLKQHFFWGTVPCLAPTSFIMNDQGVFFWAMWASTCWDQSRVLFLMLLSILSDPHVALISSAVWVWQSLLYIPGSVLIHQLGRSASHSPACGCAGAERVTTAGCVTVIYPAETLVQPLLVWLYHT